MATLLITGGTVVTATGRCEADVLVDGEKIVAVLTPGSTLLGTDLAAGVDTVIDASGKYVIPGGIDAHTHMELPFGGTNASDTFETGTIAAAWGGTTSIIDFAVQKTGEAVETGLAAWHEKAAGNCAVDYGFHQIIGGVDEQSLKAMETLVEEGITSYKLFMAYPGVFYSDDAQIVRAMQKAAELGLLTMMHAENGPAIDVLAEQLYNAGKTTPYFHGIARAWQLEEEATHRAIMLADLTEAPLYVVHVSAKQAVAQLAAAATGARTCSARPARNTSTSRSRSSSEPLEIKRGVTSKAPSGSARRRCARVRRATRTPCGKACAPTTYRWSRPTTARSA